MQIICLGIPTDGRGCDTESTPAHARWAFCGAVGYTINSFRPKFRPTRCSWGNAWLSNVSRCGDLIDNGDVTCGDLSWPFQRRLVLARCDGLAESCVHALVLILSLTVERVRLRLSETHCLLPVLDNYNLKSYKYVCITTYQTLNLILALSLLLNTQ